LATQKQQTIVKKAQTDMRTAILDAEKKAAISQIQMRKFVQQKHSERNISHIQGSLPT